jgi:hypothetical protein
MRSHRRMVGESYAIILANDWRDDSILREMNCRGARVFFVYVRGGPLMLASPLLVFGRSFKSLPC